jgi:hypothetical protein
LSKTIIDWKGLLFFAGGMGIAGYSVRNSNSTASYVLLSVTGMFIGLFIINILRTIASNMVAINRRQAKWETDRRYAELLRDQVATERHDVAVAEIHEQVVEREATAARHEVALTEIDAQIRERERVHDRDTKADRAE